MKKLSAALAALLLACLCLTAFAAPKMLPDIYVGTMTLEVSGGKVWTVPYMGAGKGRDDEFRTSVRETLKVVMPSFYVMNGVVADMDHPCTTTGSADYKKIKNGELIEYWTCPVQSVPPLTPMSSYAAVLAPPNVGSYHVGCSEVPLKGEHGVFNGTTWNKKQADYYTREVQIPEVPLPATEHLAGKRTIDLGDGVKAELIWDFKPRADH